MMDDKSRHFDRRAPTLPECKRTLLLSDLQQAERSALEGYVLETEHAKEATERAALEEFTAAKLSAKPMLKSEPDAFWRNTAIAAVSCCACTGFALLAFIVCVLARRS